MTARIDPPLRRRVYSAIDEQTVRVSAKRGPDCERPNHLNSTASVVVSSTLLATSMTDSEKDALAAVVEERWVDFQMALSDNRRKYPVQEFKKFVQAVRNYIERSRDDPLVHRKVVQVVNGLTNSLKVERKRIPNEILAEADRLECLMFAGYDPHFEGDEPPML